MFIYRINVETPTSSSFQIKLLPIEQVGISEAESSIPETFDVLSAISKPRPKELTTEEEDTLEKNLVWICSSARSGSTWLGRDLLSHETKYINEPTITDHLATISSYHDDKITRMIDRAKNVGSYFFSDMYKDTWKFFLRKLILNRIHAEMEDLSSKIIIKEASEIDASDIISECLPNSKLIILLRDGRDIIDSDLDGRQKGGWMIKQTGAKSIGEKNRKPYIERRAKRWYSLATNLIKTMEVHNSNLLLVIKYEDLRKNTLVELKKLYDFLEIKILDEKIMEIIDKFSFEKIPTGQKGKGKFYRSASPGKWKESFSSDEKVIIDRIMGPTLKKLGY